jgi:hypothetical protein
MVGYSSLSQMFAFETIQGPGPEGVRPDRVGVESSRLYGMASFCRFAFLPLRCEGPCLDPLRDVDNTAKPELPTRPFCDFFLATSGYIFSRFSG